MSIEARVNKLGLNGLIEDGIHVHSKELALLWQIYSRRFSMPIHFRQCGHRFDGS